jgi:hypothetical protein
MANIRAVGAVLLSILITSITSDVAEALDQRLIGAWASSASDCKELFEGRAGRLSFRRPINNFTSAFIVGVREVVAVNQTCTINGVSSTADYLKLKLECRDSISYIPIDARVKILSDARISWGDAASDPSIDAQFERCSP